MSHQAPLPDLANLSEIPVTHTDAPIFKKAKHVSYWLRCLRSPLPHQYTSNDSNRMTLAFFTVSALDLLGVLHTQTSPAERAAHVDWIYSCQCPDGGFRGFPATDFGGRASGVNRIWDPANVPATYFAVASLVVLGDDLGRVRRRECLEWLADMQRVDGSFGEVRGPDGEIRGGMDPRFGYCALCVRWMLAGGAKRDTEHGCRDVDEEKFAQCVKLAETYDGGISEAPFHEAHAGFTYCALGALSFLNRLPEQDTGAPGKQAAPSTSSSISKANVVRWLLFRATSVIAEDMLDDFEDSTSELSLDNHTLIHEEMEYRVQHAAEPDTHAVPSFSKLQSRPATHSAHASPAGWLRPPTQTFDRPNLPWVGMNGRINKVADTCYIWWVGASLAMLNSLDLVDAGPIRRYLLDKTQHLIAGGFGKLPGDPPDIYHAYLGLAALAMLGVGVGEGSVVPGLGGLTGGLFEGQNPSFAPPDRHTPLLELEGEPQRGGDGAPRVLLELDAALCFSVRAKKWLEGLGWRKKLLEEA